MIQKDSQYAWELALGASVSPFMDAFKPADVYQLVAHRVWVRGSLVSHQPIEGGTPEWRCAQWTKDGLVEVV